MKSAEQANKTGEQDHFSGYTIVGRLLFMVCGFVIFCALAARTHHHWQY